MLDVSEILKEFVHGELDFAGLERARLLADGYAVEYDYADPRQLEPTLQLRGV
mgnify:CR=1 FL=1